MSAVAQIIEMDQERDRKTCLSLDLKVTGANRELAQWLVDHPQYPDRAVGQWLGRHHSYVNRLRKWARNGCEGLPFDLNNKPDPRSEARSGADRRQEALETNNNPEPAVEHDEDGVVIEIADPEVLEDNLLHVIGGINENARVFNRLLKLSAFDREAVARINTAIDRMMGKWRSVQSTLEKKV